MRIPGIGGHLANLIIGNRRYDSLDRHRSKRYSWSAPGFPNTPPQLPLGDAGTVRTIALQLAMWVQTDQTRRNETSARP
jgi:hypothetical protein